MPFNKFGSMYTLLQRKEMKFGERINGPVIIIDDKGDLDEAKLEILNKMVARKVRR